MSAVSVLLLLGFALIVVAIISGVAFSAVAGPTNAGSERVILLGSAGGGLLFIGAVLAVISGGDSGEGE